ncbi:MAG: hypothetical protein LBG87_05965 [Spirochaetaceae bacterium]|jgi:hypothetical protein|nr:hypothetical protein [Spirochaetaceae bacterium]
MKKPLSLDELYEKHKLGEMNKREFEGCIFEHILSNYQQFYFSDWSKDQCADYLCELYPRMSAAIDSYEDVGASFEKYIKSKLCWFVKERRSRESDHSITEYAYWESCAAEKEAFTCDTEPEYLTIQTLEKKGKNGKKKEKKISNPRQVLILLLKCYFFVTDEFAARAAPALGVSRERLIEMLDALRSRRFERDQEIRQFRDRLHSQYYRCISFEVRMKSVSEGSARHAVMQGRLRRARKRLDSMKKRFNAVSLDATNRQIAEVLGIPKGTVDSNLYVLKHKIARLVATGKWTLGSHIL